MMADLKPIVTTKTMQFTFMPQRIMTMMSKERLANLEQVWEDFDDGLNITQFV